MKTAFGIFGLLLVLGTVESPHDWSLPVQVLGLLLTFLLIPIGEPQ